MYCDTYLWILPLSGDVAQVKQIAYRDAIIERGSRLWPFLDGDAEYARLLIRVESAYYPSGR
jgi:hypothetical protein